MTNDWRSFESRPGVYEIHFPNGLFYIGKSINVRKRLSEHTARLKGNKHNNKQMQATYNKYGRCSYNIISYCFTDFDAAQLEREEIVKYKNNKKCANVAIGDWVVHSNYIEYFTKPTLWVHLPSGNTHLSPSRGAWGLELIGVCRKKEPFQCAVAENYNHAQELHLAYWRDWVIREADKLLADMENERNRKKKWWYFMKNTITGRATVARNTYECREFKPAEGWVFRRYGEEWPVKNVGTPSKLVLGTHPDHGQQCWPSIGKCAKFLGRNHTVVLKALTGKQKTTAGWSLKFGL